MFKKTTLTLLILYFLSTPFPLLSTNLSLADYLADFYNRESRYLDTTFYRPLRTWHYNIPYYEPDNQWAKSISDNRWHMSLASYYHDRLALEPRTRQMVKQAIFDATFNDQSAIFDQSFNDAIADFLIIRFLESDDDRADETRLMSAGEKQVLLKWIRPRLFYGLRAADTENRAALAGVYWYYVARYLNQNNLLSADEFQYVDEQCRDKIEQSITDTIRSDDWLYREDGQFSLHYHWVEAFMLLAYGQLTNNSKYIDLAAKMTSAANKLVANGQFSAEYLGHRPPGLAAQTYLIAGIMNLYFNVKKIGNDFLNTARGDQFFSDPEHPDRLVWINPEEDDVTRRFNDDISFVNMAEMAEIIFNF